MGLADIFRSIFDRQTGCNDNTRIGDVSLFRNEQNNEQEGSYFHRSGDNILDHFHSSMMQQMEEMSQEMDKIFQSFEAVMTPTTSFQDGMKQNQSESLRDGMLRCDQDDRQRGVQSSPFQEFSEKTWKCPSQPGWFSGIFNLPVWNPEMFHNKVDTDISIREMETDKPGTSSVITGDEHMKSESTPGPIFRSIFIQRIHKADGTVEERRSQHYTNLW